MTEIRRSYARRFVRSAWLLLIVQLFSALVAICVTAWAAFYVADLRAERDDLRVRLEHTQGYSEAQAESGAANDDPATESVPVGPVIPSRAEPSTSIARPESAPPTRTRPPATAFPPTTSPSEPNVPTDSAGPNDTPIQLSPAEPVAVPGSTRGQSTQTPAPGVNIRNILRELRNRREPAREPVTEPASPVADNKPSRPDPPQ